MPVWQDAADATAFVRIYSGMILRVCFTYSYSLGRADAQDVCQNVFLKLLQIDRKFDTEGETRAFILRMVINECKDILKSGWRRRSVPFDELIERDSLSPCGRYRRTGYGTASASKIPRGHLPVLLRRLQCRRNCSDGRGETRRRAAATRPRPCQTQTRTGGQRI